MAEVIADTVARVGADSKPRRRRVNFGLLSMLLPGTLALFFFSYMPMAYVFIAFKNINYTKGLWRSPWTGFKNFEFFLKTPDAWVITRNSVLYNIAFIVLGTIAAVGVAVALDGLRAKRTARFYQGVMFLPYFFSWIVISTLVFSFLSTDLGFFNKQLFPLLGIAPVNWYIEPVYWPFILIFTNLWKYTGYASVIYLAAIAGIDQNCFEAAALDGAGRWQVIMRIMIPLISYVIIIQVLLSIGRLFYSDFGLFYQVPQNMGPLFKATNVIDTYVYRTLVNVGDIGMSAAACLYQAAVGFVLVLLSNLVVRRIDPEKSVF
ncbi:MAG TPA: ABC transporter permease subunit [Spirochaetia bacterium]|nr:ABC transporter permease subunit [Spirochaetia bacterium]